ncbi:putative transcription factor B3-Domain family [Medicago truncatula]|uniref:Putative transcription factor B3-Domain family n=1 Tax=Medicago truncatula TaxID=3880 RepID=A0A396HRL7_MEDTR|nr:putative transcription factor B3-Domain family [Medicago truncatula]
MFLFLFFLLQILPCIISAVNLFVDALTDEVFAKLLLTPLTAQEPPPPPPVVPGQEDDDGNNLVSYFKTLTTTETKSVFNISHECADLIFPKLDLEKSQIIIVTDLKSQEWGCTYVKNSRLRTGWSHFRKEKKLVAKDSVVFMKNSAGKILV